MKNNQVEKLTVYSRCTCSTYRIRNHRSKTGPKNIIKTLPLPIKNGHGLVSLPRENEPRLHLEKQLGGFPRTGKKIYIRSVKENCNQ